MQHTYASGQNKTTYVRARPACTRQFSAWMREVVLTLETRALHHAPVGVGPVGCGVAVRRAVDEAVCAVLRAPVVNKYKYCRTTTRTRLLGWCCCRLQAEAEQQQLSERAWAGVCRWCGMTGMAASQPPDAAHQRGGRRAASVKNNGRAQVGNPTESSRPASCVCAADRIAEKHAWRGPQANCRNILDAASALALP